jgi:DNA-binding MarR family transcriptional regulator
MRSTADPATNEVAYPDAREALVEELVRDLDSSLGRLRCAASQRLLRLGISMTHLHVLRLLRYHGAVTMTRLAELLDTSMSSATGIIDRMEERGLVRRDRGADDRRVVVVDISSAGATVLAEAELISGDVMTRVLDQLDEVRLRRLAACIEDIRSAVASLDLVPADPA